MHTYGAPVDALNGWLKSYPSTIEDYGHLLLEQVGNNDESLVNAFRPYFESAHFDARQHFHEVINIDLHPDAGEPGANAVYPNCLPTKTRRGLFGEVMAGMLTERYEYIGGHDWQIPIFLFRYHEDVESYLFTLARNPAQTRGVLGRHGSDFLALALDDEGRVVRYLAGEAKWRKTLTPSAVKTLLMGPIVQDAHGNRARSGKGIWHQFNVRDTTIPHGIRQLQRLLLDYDPNGFAAAILSIDKALLLTDAEPIARTNLVFICGNDYASRDSGEALVEWESKPADYTSPHALQVVELILANGEALIDEIYDHLWCDP